MLKHYILIIVLATFTFKVSISIGQNIRSYDSTYTIDSKRFLANYEYYLSGKDTIYDGNFELMQQFENQEHIYEYLSVQGYFTDNQADENWTLKKGTFAPTGSGYYKDYTYSYDVDGHEFMALGKFKTGKKTGEWKLYDWKIRSSDIKDTTLTATIHFAEDKAQGTFKLQFQNDILEGELGENEMTTGVWSFYRSVGERNKKLVKEWVFEDNILVAMRLRKNQSTHEIKVNNLRNANLSEETIPLDQEFLEIIELKARIYNEELIGQYKDEYKIANLFFTLLDNMELVDNTFSPIIKSKIKPAIASKLRAYKINQEEKDFLKDLQLECEANIQKAESILNNSQFNIASVSTNKVAEFKNVIEDIKNFFLIPTKDILTLYENEQLKFFNRDQLIQYKIDLSSKSSVNRVFNTDSLSNNYEFRSALSFSADQSNLSKLSILMIAIDNELKLIEVDLQEYLEDVQEEENLVELEEIMLAKYEKSKYLADSLITGEHDNFAGIDVAQAIIDFLDAELANYSKLPSTAEKTAAIEPLINCFNRTEELIHTVHKAPESIYKINEAYTKEVFNPYTFTNMEEKSKPSIFKAFNKMLLPGIFQNMQHLRCDNMMAFEANFKILYDEMIDLLNEDHTNRKERKVKRAKTPAKASEILDMKLSF